MTVATLMRYATDNSMNSERKAYLSELAEDYGVPPSVVFYIASILGESEDYDGLVTSLEDLADEYE